LRGFGFDGAADVFESMDGLFDNIFSDNEDEIEDEKKKKQKNKSKQKGKNKGRKNKGRKNKFKKKGGKNKPKNSKWNKNNHQLDDSDHDNEKSTKLNKNQKSPAKQNKLGKSFGKSKGGMLKSLMKSPASKVLGRVAAPISAIMGAISIGSTLNDDSLSAAEKSKGVGAAAGGAGGALAGAAAGAALGSIIPGVGTVIGGLVGGALGAFGGESLGEGIGGFVGGFFSDDEEKQDKLRNNTNTTKSSSLLDNNEHKTVNNISPQNQPKSAASNSIDMLDVLKKNMGEITLATGTLKDNKDFSPAQRNKAVKVNKFTGALDIGLNVHSIIKSLFNENLSGRQKSKEVGKTLGSMSVGYLGSQAVAKIPYVGPALSPLGGYLGGKHGGEGGEYLGGEIYDFFSGNKISDPEMGVKPKINAENDSSKSKSIHLTELDATKLNSNSSPNKGTEKKSNFISPSVANVTVNAEINVNATADMDKTAIAEEIKQILEAKERDALRDLRLRYIDEVA
ncbi:hypothetical protein SAMN02745724_03748, partial [Pseudoalteromonas denitrificans DSM 6059]